MGENDITQNKAFESYLTDSMNRQLSEKELEAFEKQVRSDLFSQIIKKDTPAFKRHWLFGITSLTLSVLIVFMLILSGQITLQTNSNDTHSEEIVATDASLISEIDATLAFLDNEIGEINSMENEMDTFDFEFSDIQY